MTEPCEMLSRMALRPLGPELWVAHAPLRFLGLELGRVMAAVRLDGGDLLVHSPAPLDGQLRDELAALGRVRYVVAASSLHGHVSMGDYAAAYPDCELLAPPGLEGKRRDLRFAGALGDEPDPRWAGTLDQALLRGHRVCHEVLLGHRPSGTLIAGDVCWNVTDRLGLPARLWAGRRRGVGPTRAFRLGFADRAAARASIDRVLAWDFDRIVCGHGDPVEAGGHEAFRRAYEWL